MQPVSAFGPFWNTFAGLMVQLWPLWVFIIVLGLISAIITGITRKNKRPP